jgi:hypothetical protein
MNRAVMSRLPAGNGTQQLLLLHPNSCSVIYILQQNGSHEHEIMREEISSEAESACSATLSSEGETHSAHEIPKV